MESSIVDPADPVEGDLLDVRDSSEGGQVETRVLGDCLILEESHHALSSRVAIGVADVHDRVVATTS